MLGGLLGGLLGSSMGKKKAVKIEQLPAQYPNAKKIRMYWGPLKVKGANVRTLSASRITLIRIRVLLNSAMDHRWIQVVLLGTS